MASSLICGDALTTLKKLSPIPQFDACISSPPYFQLCDYRHDEQYGMEDSLANYIDRLVEVFREVRNRLYDGGCLFLIVGDTANNYSPIRGKGERRIAKWGQRRSLQPGYLEKEFLGVPFILRDYLRADGWYCRNTLIWDKGSSGAYQPATDTPAQTHEYIFQFFKWDGRGRPYLNCGQFNRGSVMHYATASDLIHPCPFPVELARRLLWGYPKHSHILDPFAGVASSGVAAQDLGLNWLGIELNSEYYHRGLDRLKKPTQLVI